MNRHNERWRAESLPDQGQRIIVSRESLPKRREGLGTLSINLNVWRKQKINRTGAGTQI